MRKNRVTQAENLTVDSADVNVVFLSLNLNRIPSFSPEELNLTYMLERIRNLEEKVGNHEESLTNQRIDILKTQDKLEQIERENKPAPDEEVRLQSSITQIRPIAQEDVNDSASPASHLLI